MIVSSFNFTEKLLRYVNVIIILRNFFSLGDAELTEVNLVIDQAIDQIAAMTQSEIAAVR